MFTVPDSDTPSTPLSRRDSSNFPSTTPAGPPPTDYTNNSFTPAGPPPSTIFGSSQLNNGLGTAERPAFTSTGRLNNNIFAQSTASHNGNSMYGARQGNQFGLLGSSPPKGGFLGHNNDDDEDAEGEEDEEMFTNEHGKSAHSEYQEDGMEKDETPHWNMAGSTLSEFGLGNGSIDAGAGGLFAASQGLKMPRLQDLSTAPIFSSVENDQEESKYDFSKLALGHSSNSTKSEILEPDALILAQEELLQQLHASLQDDGQSVSRILQQVSTELPRIWTVPEVQQEQQSKSQLKQAKSLDRAKYLASLLLPLHHPPRLQQQQPDLSASFLGRSIATSHATDTPIPKVLLDWLNNHHSTFISDLDTVLSLKTDFSSSAQFWDGVMSSCLRGRFADTIKLLKHANFHVAYTAISDGSRTPGYRDAQLNHIEKVVNDAVVAIEACPAVRFGDWDVKGERWRIYRRVVGQAIEALREFSEGASYDRSATRGSFAASSRQAESRVPWTVYENLLIVYQHFLGNPEELLNSSVDWVEATIALTAWWDGEDDQDTLSGSVMNSRVSLSRSHRGRLTENFPLLAYRRKLAASIRVVTNLEDEELDLNSSNPVHVALGCIFDGKLEEALALIRCLSVPVAAAVEEIASVGKWGHSASRDIMKGFDNSDLMVMSFAKSPHGDGFGRVSKDEQLLLYAECLSQKDEYVDEETGKSKEGWQLSMQVLSRLDKDLAANAAIDELLESLNLDSTDRVDKVVLELKQMGFQLQASSIAERYADTLAATTYDYGPTLVYYARAHNTEKLHSILDLLISLSLVNSTAYPPITDLDDHLNALLQNPKKTIGNLSRIDEEAAELLANSLSGYATVRKFYDLRDEEITANQTGTKPTHRPLARRRAATDALMTLIASSSTPIRGGLYDPDAESVLQVDGLLVLLGEALPLLKLEPCPVDMSHLNTLLAAIEDLVSSPSLIREQCEECLRSTLATAHGAAASSSPRDLMRKSTSALSEKTGTTASSQFSLVGSSLLSGRSEGSSGSTVLTDRAWDWRRGFGAETTLTDVIRVLRVTVADVVARAWIEGDGFEE